MGIGHKWFSIGCKLVYKNQPLVAVTKQLVQRLKLKSISVWVRTYYLWKIPWVSTGGRHFPLWISKFVIFAAFLGFKCLKADFSVFLEAPQSLIFLVFLFFCWLAAWGLSYKGKPWRLNQFIVITFYQQQHNSYLLFLLFNTFNTFNTLNLHFFSSRH